MSKDNISTKIQELDKLLAFFESQTELDLDQGLEKYEQAMKLVSDVKKSLEGYELKINEIQSKYKED